MHSIRDLRALFGQWLTPPIFSDDEEKSRAAALLNTILLTLLAISGVYFVAAPFLETSLRAGLSANAGTIVVYLSILALMRRGYVRLAGRLFVATFWLMVTLVAIGYGSTVTPAFLSYFSSILVTGILLGGPSAIWLAGLSIITGAALLSAESRGLLPPPLLTTSGLSMWGIAAVNFVMVAVLLALADRSLRLALQRAQQNEGALAERNTTLRHEIAERRRVEAEREALIIDLEAKNAELERFTYTISHDLKNPLITIQGFLGLLEKDALAGDSERVRRDIERIRDAGAKMQQLLQDLLDLARVGQALGAFYAIPFATIVSDAQQLVTWRLKAGGIELQIAPDLPVVYGDYARLVEALQNLIDNAAKYMGRQPSPQITIGYAGADSGMHRIFVRDNGIGIAPQYHEQVFELFSKLDPQSEGTGVGLALVRRIIEGHGGQIAIESEGLGAGTTFWLTLPIPPATEG